MSPSSRVVLAKLRMALDTPRLSRSPERASAVMSEGQREGQRPSRLLRLWSSNQVCPFTVASAASTLAISRSKVLRRMPFGLGMKSLMPPCVRPALMATRRLVEGVRGMAATCSRFYGPPFEAARELAARAEA